MKVVILILQLFFATDPTEVRLEKPMNSIEECHKQVGILLNLTEFQGRKLAGVGAGCTVNLIEGNPA